MVSASALGIMAVLSISYFTESQGLAHLGISPLLETGVQVLGTYLRWIIPMISLSTIPWLMVIAVVAYFFRHNAPNVLPTLVAMILEPGSAMLCIALALLAETERSDGAFDAIPGLARQDLSSLKFRNYALAGFFCLTPIFLATKIFFLWAMTGCWNSKISITDVWTIFVPAHWVCLSFVPFVHLAFFGESKKPLIAFFMEHLHEMFLVAVLCTIRIIWLVWPQLRKRPTVQEPATQPIASDSKKGD